MQAMGLMADRIDQLDQAGRHDADWPSGLNADLQDSTPIQLSRALSQKTFFACSLLCRAWL